MNDIAAIEKWNSDLKLDQLMCEYDDTAMSLPNIEFEPHLLISKVRKHYMEYMIKLLSLNYETHQKLINKNIYLPSAIWRCAKNIELTAAQACMVVQLYRNNIVAVIKELKKDTKNGKLYKKLYECLNKPPENEKKTQTTMNKTGECNCQCNCNQSKRRRRISKSPKITENQNPSAKVLVNSDNLNESIEQYAIPVAINLQTQSPRLIINHKDFKLTAEQPPPTPKIVDHKDNLSPKTNIPISVESQDSDELMMQLEKLFQGDPNDDDLFEGTLCDSVDSTAIDENKKLHNEISQILEGNVLNKKQDLEIENHAAQIKSLDERLVTLAGLLVNNNEANVTQLQSASSPKSKKNNTSKWLCEEYFLKVRLFELLDKIGDSNRKELARIKELFVELFGNDSDDEGVVSPLNETPEFIISCKERIAPWVVKLLTPYYIKGRIKGKTLFKALAKHLIRLIYQCSRYPGEYEVTSFVADFLENHKMIRCEADFKEFRIENI